MFHFNFASWPLMAALLFAGSQALAQTDLELQDDAEALNTCLAAWGHHPFGSQMRYTRLSTAVKVAGRGSGTADYSATDHPSLILVDPLVTARGDASLSLLNPQGWYCLRAPENEWGALRIRLHCHAHLASATGGATLWGRSSGRLGRVTVGAMQVERLGCSRR